MVYWYYYREEHAQGHATFTPHTCLVFSHVTRTRSLAHDLPLGQLRESLLPKGWLPWAPPHGDMAAGSEWKPCCGHRCWDHHLPDVSLPIFLCIGAREARSRSRFSSRKREVHLPQVRAVRLGWAAEGSCESPSLFRWDPLPLPTGGIRSLGNVS